MDEDTTVLGVLADQVEEVLEIAPQSIEAAPRIGTRLRTDFIQGMGKRDEEFIIILDIDKVFSGEELSVVQGAEEETVGA
jgi:purine-binding chemotaxis protein CheW